MDSFQYIWALLAPKGEYKRRYNACRRLWESYPIEQQRYIYTTIRTKKTKGEYVNPNPYFAIEDNSIPANGPYNWNGDRRIEKMMSSGKVVCAKYNGKWGMYTREDVVIFGMEKKVNN